MRVFVTGASGHIGTPVVEELVAAGHEVVGLARSEESAERIESSGAGVLRGDLDDLDALARASSESDGVIHLAYKHEQMFSGNMEAAFEADRLAIEAMGDALAGSERPFVGTGGTALLAMGGITGRPGTEEDVIDGQGRIANENAAIALADRGVRTSVVRLAPTVHSSLDLEGFVPALIGMAREKGVSGYIGDGANVWPAVHTLDAARLYRLALESAAPGSRLHGTAEGGVPFRDIAEAIANGLGVESRSFSPEEAADQFGFLAGFVAVDNPVTAEITRRELGWEPRHPELLEDMASGHYFR